MPLFDKNENFFITLSLSLSLSEKKPSKSKSSMPPLFIAIVDRTGRDNDRVRTQGRGALPL